MIRLHQVRKVFSSSAGEFVALKKIDLTIHKGEFVAVIGKSGSGKSTLLNMITGIDHPSAGKVVVNGTDLYSKMNESQRSVWRGKNMGIVFQFFQLIPNLSLLENVLLPMDFAKTFPTDDRIPRAQDLLAQVGLEAFLHKLPDAVSTGQQQAASIARALANDPPLLVADEPTGNLDSKSADVIINLFQTLAKQEKTVVMVTHDPSLTQHTSRTVIISEGELVDEAIALALPFLNHRQMLALTHSATRRVIPSGESIPSESALYVIRSGEVDVTFARDHSETISKRLGVGDSFYYDRNKPKQTGLVLAAHAGNGAEVEVILLPFQNLIEAGKESPVTAQYIDSVIHNRFNRSDEGRTL